VTALFVDADQAAVVRDALSKRGFDILHLKGGYPDDLANAVRITIGHVKDRGRFLQALDEALQEVLKRKPVLAANL
jgi:histidinol-phosphate/aromatic aminotransferase/cobyric acid decarboxylase-like protein